MWELCIWFSSALYQYGFSALHHMVPENTLDDVIL
jgi:hypothetical protein